MERIDFRYLYDLSEINGVIHICMSIGLITSFYVCPTYGKQMVLKPRSELNDKFEWVCRTKKVPAHHVKRSIRSGTWFAVSRMSIKDILIMTHYFVHDAAHKMIAYELRVSPTTVTDWRSFFREVCLEACLRMNEPLGGEGVIVEIDESKFGKRKSNRGSRVDGKWVFGGVERGSNKCFFKVVESRDKVSLLNVLKTFVLPGTTVYSDCWRFYDCLEDEGFRHLTVNHSLHFVNPDTGVHANAIEGTWSAIKRSLPSRTVSDQFDSYLAEYMWRRRHSDSDDLTKTFLADVCQMYAPWNRDPPPAEDEEERRD